MQFSRRNLLMFPAALAMLPADGWRQQKPAPATATPNLDQLPPNLPVPKDDGGCRHLPGMAMPNIELVSTSNYRINLSKLTAPRTVVYFYPMTGQPGKALPAGWDDIPGARGCTLETCGFRDLHKELARLNADVYGVSVQSTGYQKEMGHAAERAVRGAERRTDGTHPRAEAADFYCWRHDFD